MFHVKQAKAPRILGAFFCPVTFCYTFLIDILEASCYTVPMVVVSTDNVKGIQIMKTIKTQAKETLAKMLQSKKDDLARLTKSIAAIEGKPEHLDEIRFAIGLARRYGGTMGYSYISGSTISLTVHFTVKTFKKGLVCRILTACNELDVSSSSDWVSEYGAQHSYHFKFGSGNSLTVEYNLENGLTYKQIVIGSKTHTELIYAIEC